MTMKSQKPTARPVAPKPPCRVSVGLDPAIYEKLKQAAKAERRSAANLLSCLLEAHFDKREAA